MGMTMTQKIFAAHAGLPEVSAGQLVLVNLDRVLGNDVTSPVAIREFNKMGKEDVYDKEKVIMVMDHFAPNKDIKAAEQCKCCRDFAEDLDVPNFYDVGTMGVEHALLPEKGLVKPGDLMIGADSHTCTYGAVSAFSTGVGSTDMACGMAVGKTWLKVPEAIKFVITGDFQEYVSGKDLILHIIGMIGVDGALYKSMEFTGPGLKNLTLDDRLTICNMAIEAGAKNGIFEFDEVTKGYVDTHGFTDYVEVHPDDDAEYSRVIEINLSDLKSTVAFPHLPENTHTMEEIQNDMDDIKVDQVYIGSCTNGRYADLKVAAEILMGKKIAKHVRAIVIPSTPDLYLKVIEEGWARIFIEAGCTISTPTCGPCLGGHMGILAHGERAISTSNRNFVGRMGDPTSEVYLCSPAIAAASAIAGKIASPEEVL